MNELSDFLKIQRIIVPLDSSPESIAALEPAAWIASVISSKLSALLIEEQELFTLANLPFSREISIVQPRARNLDPTRLEQEMRARAVTMQKKIARIAQRHRVEWSFEVVRGDRDREIAAQAEARDLIAVFSDRRAHRLRGEPKFAAGFHATDAASGLLLVGRNASYRSGPVLTLFDGTAASQQALRLAADIARRNNLPLRVLIANGDRDQREDLARVAHEILSEGSFVDFQLETGIDAESALQRLGQREQGVLVLADSSDSRFGDHLMVTTRCPMIILKTAVPDDVT